MHLILPNYIFRKFQEFHWLMRRKDWIMARQLVAVAPEGRHCVSEVTALKCSKSQKALDKVKDYTSVFLLWVSSSLSADTMWQHLCWWPPTFPVAVLDMLSLWWPSAVYVDNKASEWDKESDVDNTSWREDTWRDGRIVLKFSVET
jgi:hypothetical protein